MSTSRLQKQKQILSMLNAQRDEDPVDIAALTVDETDTASTTLLKQVFGFHKRLIHSINAGLITIDLKGEITFANKVAAGLMGLEVGDLLGMHLQELFCQPAEGERFLRSCTRRGKRIDNWESQLFHPQKRQFWAGINAAALDDTDNQFKGVVVLLRDLTDLYELRGQVKRMEHLALLGEMASGIAHEIRNPLAGIKSTAQLLAEEGQLSDFQGEVISRMIREVDKANRRITDFLLFARPNRARPDFYPFATILSNAYTLLSAQIRQGQVRFEHQIPDNLPPVYVDRLQIEQILLNLIINALDAMPDGGQLLVLAKRRLLLGSEGRGREATGKQVYVEVQLKDNGAGIAADHMEKIFQPFFTTKPHGVGLGLAICSRLIEENRGKIDVISHNGKGTNVLFALPAFAAHA